MENLKINNLTVLLRVFFVLSVLFFSFSAKSSPPDWTPTPNLQYNMNVVGQLQIEDGVFSMNPEDLVAAFVGEECRGVTSPMADFQGILFLTIGSNQLQGETITFKAYLADTGEIHELDQTIVFENQLMVGNPGEPFIFTFTSEPDLYTLSISANPPAGGTVNGAGSYPQGQTVNISANAAQGFEFVNWTGNIQHVVNPSSPTTTVVMPAQNVNLTANFQPVEPDLFTVTFIVTDEDANPVADAVVNFDGTNYPPGVYVIQDVEPGNYNYAVSKAGFQPATGQVNVTNSNVVENVVLEMETDGPPNWVPVANLQYNMNVIGKLQIDDGVFAMNPNDLVGAFVGAECRGVQSPDASGFIFLTIGSNVQSGETITFKAYLADTGEIEDINQTLVFENLVMIGTPADPFIFTIEGEPDLYSLSLSANPPNGGTVNGAGDYPQGQTVNITANPAQGFEFVNWTGDIQHLADPSNPATSLVMPAQNVNLTANFQPVPPDLYTLTLDPQPAAGGVVEGGGEYEAGTVVPVSATANAGWEFVEWKQNGVQVSNSPNFNFTMPAANVTLHAHFIEEDLPPQNFIVAYNVVGANGTLSAFVDDSPITSGDLVEEDKTVEFIAEPDEGYQVKEWRRNGMVLFGYTADIYMIYNLSENITVTVEFEIIPPDTHLVEFHVEGENGTLSASVDGNAIESGDAIEEGKTVVFEAQPDEGYQVKQWMLNGSVVTRYTAQTYTVSDLSENIIVTVEFEELPPNTHTVNFHVIGGNGTLSASVDGNPIQSGSAVIEGKTVVFQAQPNTGYGVKEWRRNGLLLWGYTALTYTFTNLSANITVTVEFKPIADVPTLSVNPQLLEFDDVLIEECDLKSYLLTGENLTADVTINAPEGFQVSTNANMGYSESIIVEHTDGIVNQTIYVQFCPMAEQTYSGNITNTSGETSANVFVSGDGYDEITEDSNIMKVHDAIAQVNGVVTIELEIINDNEFVGFNLDIPIPEGFSYIDGSAQIYRDDGHIFNFGIISGNVARMISFSIFNTPFLGNSGIIVSFDVQAPEAEGNYVFDIADDAVIADADGNNLITGTIPGTITLTDSNMVVFNITDINGDVIDDAIITLGNQTNEAGDYVFENVIAGNYDYSVEKDCYITVEGHLPVTGGNQQVDIMLENLPGDANGDGVVNVSDIVIMSNYFMGDNPQQFCFVNADINGDGVINVQDIVGVSNIFMGGKSQPFPFIESEKANLYLFKDGIYLESDGTITGLQFQLNGSMLNDINLSNTLPDHELLFKHENNVLTALLFSFNNTAIPEGKIKIIDFADADETPRWGDGIVLANINADWVPVNLYHDELTSLQEFSGIFDFKIYPNPSEGEVWVEFNNKLNQQIDLSVFNLHGQVITNKSINEPGLQRLHFTFNDIPAGVYFLKLQSNKDTIIEKIVFK